MGIPIEPVLPDGPGGGLLGIGEAPGKVEVAKGFGFAGSAGRNLDRALATFGMAREGWARANAVLCRPDNAGCNRKPSASEIEACLPNLQAAIQRLRPRVILVVGETAGSALGLYDKKRDGGWLDFVLEKQRSYLERGEDALPRYCAIPAMVSPHTSPLAWNRKHEGQPIKAIGEQSVRIALEVLART